MLDDNFYVFPFPGFWLLRWAFCRCDRTKILIWLDAYTVAMRQVKALKPNADPDLSKALDIYFELWSPPTIIEWCDHISCLICGNVKLGFWLIEWLYSNNPVEQCDIWLKNNENKFRSISEAQKFYFHEWRSPLIIYIFDWAKWRINELVANLLNNKPF